MRHHGRMLDERLDAAERLGKREEPGLLEQGGGRLKTAPHHAGDHAAAARHLTLRQFVLRVAGREGPGDRLHRGMGFEQRHHLLGVGGVLAHAHAERLDAAKHEEAVHGAGDGADGVLQKVELLGEAVVARYGNAADHVGVAVDELGRGVNDDVGAVVERRLKDGRHEGVVHHHERTGRVGNLSECGDIDQLQHGIGRRLEPEHLRVGPQVLPKRGGVREVSEGELHAEAGEHLGEEPVGAAVEVVAGHHMVAGAEEVEDGVGGRAARGKGDAMLAVLDRSDAGLKRVTGRVLRPRVLVALVDAGARLHIGRGLEDGRHNGAGGGVGLLAGVDGECVFMHVQSCGFGRFGLASLVWGGATRAALK